MPFIYTATEIVGKAFQHPEFQRREIHKMTTGRLENIHIIGVPAVKQPAYEDYIANIPAFLLATATQKKVTCNLPSYPLPQFPINLVIPLELPPIVVSPKRPLKTDGEKTEFQATLPGRVDVTRQAGREVYLMRGLRLEDLSRIPTATVDPNTPISSDTTNLVGINNFLFVLRLLTLFLSTHTYPAFSSGEQDVDPSRVDAEIHFKETGFVPGKRSRRGPESLYVDREVVWDAPVETVGSASSGKWNRFSDAGKVVVAKPAPFYPDVNFGPASSIPNLPGYVFPHFPALHEPSESSILATIRRYFAASIANSTDGTGFWRSFVPGLHKWSRTDAGKCVQHIFFCMQIALESQARLFVIVGNRKYLGCAILGFKFTITRGPDMLVPDTSKTVRTLALELDKHTEALDEICGMLSRVALREGGMTIDLSPSEVKSSRDLHRELQKREPITGEEYDQLAERVSQLTFEESFWPMTTDKLETWIRFLASEEPIPNEWPMHISRETIYDSSRAYLVLSAFGPTAPSLVDQMGSEFVIPIGVDADDPSSVVDASGRRPLDFIVVSAKKLSIAVGDSKNMVKKRRIRQNLVERAAGFRTIKVVGERRNRLWDLLKTIPGENIDKGKKRSRAEEGDEESEARRKRGKERSEGEEEIVFSLDL